MDTFLNRTTEPHRVFGVFFPGARCPLVRSQVVGGGMVEARNPLEKKHLPEIPAIDLSCLVLPRIDGRPALSSDKSHSNHLPNTAGSPVVVTRQLVLDPHHGLSDEQPGLRY